MLKNGSPGALAGATGARGFLSGNGSENTTSDALLAIEQMPATVEGLL